MIAILIKQGTKYDCKHFQKGQNMIANCVLIMSKFIVESHDHDFLTNHVKIKF